MWRNGADLDLITVEGSSCLQAFVCYCRSPGRSLEPSLFSFSCLDPKVLGLGGSRLEREMDGSALPVLSITPSHPPHASFLWRSRASTPRLRGTLRWFCPYSTVQKFLDVPALSVAFQLYLLVGGMRELYVHVKNYGHT